MSYILSNRLLKYERECLSEIYNQLHYISEGHTLINHIDKIINVYNIVNDRLKNAAPIDDKEVQITISLPDFKPFKITGLKYNITIPFEELGLEDIIKSKNHNLKLNIFNIDNYEYLPEEIWNKVAGGRVLHVNNDKVEKGVFIQDDNYTFNKIEIDCYALDGDIEPIGFYSVFLHEFNHYVEGYNRIKNSSYNSFLDRVNKMNSLKKSIDEDERFFSDNDKKCLNNILYRLWQEGEKNSLIGNLFGELVGRKVKDETDVGDLKSKYKIFSKYEELKNDLQYIENNIKSEDLYNFFFVCNIYDFILGGKKVIMTPNKFKKYFIQHSEDLLKKMYKKGIKFIGDYLKIVGNFEDKHITKHIYVK